MCIVSFYSEKPPSSVRNVLGMVNVNTDWLTDTVLVGLVVSYYPHKPEAKINNAGCKPPLETSEGVSIHTHAPIETGKFHMLHNATLHPDYATTSTGWFTAPSVRMRLLHNFNLLCNFAKRMRNMVLYFKREMKQCNRQRCFATLSWSQSNTRTTSIPFDWRDHRVSKPYNRAILKPNHVK